MEQRTTLALSEVPRWNPWKIEEKNGIAYWRCTYCRHSGAAQTPGQATRAAMIHHAFMHEWG